MVAHVGDVGGAFLACDAAGREGRIEVGGVFGVEAVDFHLPGAVNVFAILHIDAHVGYSSGFGAEEEQIAKFAFMPIRAFDFQSVECLLGSISCQNHATAKIAHLHQSRAVGEFGGSAAPEVARAQHTVCGFEHEVKVQVFFCPL